MNNCRTCKWAQWVMTNHKGPRVNLSKMGRCVYPAERIALPMAFRRSLMEVNACVKQDDIGYVDPLKPHVNCRVWENKLASPGAQKAGE